MKKIINHPDHVVMEMLAGLQKENSSLAVNLELGVVSRKHHVEKVGIVSGGGSGHEPAHAGYVGYGMLDAAVAGNVFASPSPDRILEGIHQADNGKGVLLIIKNYSGDIMNFSMAKEIAEMENINVEKVIVKDDVAVEDSTYSTGRRGIAGTMLVQKIAGAMAEKGSSLADVKKVAEKAIQNVRSIGMAMTPCTLPGVGKPNFTLGDNEIEIGMGIHGEPGIERTEVKSSKDLVKILLDKILADYDFSNAEVCLLVNGLGGTPLMELYIVNNDAQTYLEEKNIKVIKNYVGNYMTSLEMSGCSLTLLKVDKQLKELLDYPVYTTALKGGSEHGI